MAWTTPRTYVAGEVLTAAILNTDHRDNIVHLGGDRISHKTFEPTLTDIDNTTTETAAFSATINTAINDKDSLHCFFGFEILNSSGSTKDIDWDVAYGGQEGDVANWGVQNYAGSGYYGFGFVLQRRGSDAWVFMTPMPSHSLSGTDLFNAAYGVKLTAPTFTSGQTLALKGTWSAANANTYIRPEIGTCHYKGVAT